MSVLKHIVLNEN